MMNGTKMNGSAKISRFWFLSVITCADTALDPSCVPM
jgi:hypothetical protein